VKKHYRFTESYKKIIDIDEINKNGFLETIKDSIKQITGNHYIELISEDKGKIGNNLKIQDIWMILIYFNYLFFNQLKYLKYCI